MKEKLLRFWEQHLRPLALKAWDYAKTPEFKKLSLTLLGAFIIFYLFFFLVFLPLFTKHGSEARVPNVTNMNLEKAQEKIESADLDFEVTDSVYNIDGEPFAVIKQFPLPGSRVKPGRKVLLTVNKKQPPLVKMPKLVDKSLYQARAILKSWKLKVGDIKYVPGDVDAADEIVLRVMSNGRKLSGGEEIAQGTKIDLYISEGIKESLVANPDLTGLEYDKAEAMLRLRNLIAIPMYNDVSRPAGIVYSQFPSKSDKDSLREGSTVEVYIGGTAPENAEAGSPSEGD